MQSCVLREQGARPDKASRGAPIAPLETKVSQMLRTSLERIALHNELAALAEAFFAATGTKAPAVHEFETSGEAYDACQCDETIANGDVLLIASEGVVGVADTWPVAVTFAYGKLHTPGEGYTLAACLEGRAAASGIHFAKVIAERLGFEIRA